MYPSIFNSFPVIRTASAKNRHFHVPQLTFLFPLETPLRLSRNMLHGWKDSSMLAKPLAACYPSIFNSFPVIRTASAKKAQFSRTTAHIFVSPGDVPGAITLNVVWMERDFHAYKLSRCMCPSNYNPFWDVARYLWKNRHFTALAFDAPVRGVPVGISAPPLGRKN